MDLDWIELKKIYKFLYGSTKTQLIRIEFVMSRIGSPTRMVILIMLDFVMFNYFFNQTY